MRIRTIFDVVAVYGEWLRCITTTTTPKLVAAMTESVMYYKTTASLFDNRNK